MCCKGGLLCNDDGQETDKRVLVSMPFPQPRAFNERNDKDQSEAVSHTSFHFLKKSTIGKETTTPHSKERFVDIPTKKGC